MASALGDRVDPPRSQDQRDSQPGHGQEQPAPARIGSDQWQIVATSQRDRIDPAQLSHPRRGREWVFQVESTEAQGRPRPASVSDSSVRAGRGAPARSPRDGRSTHPSWAGSEKLEHPEPNHGEAEAHQMAEISQDQECREDDDATERPSLPSPGPPGREGDRKQAGPEHEAGEPEQPGHVQSEQCREHRGKPQGPVVPRLSSEARAPTRRTRSASGSLPRVRRCSAARSRRGAW